jgi:hypothetical protein
MKKSLNIIFLILISVRVYSQEQKLYQTGLTAEQNMNAIGNLVRSASAGATGFDTRYEGIKGSPVLFDTLYPSYLKIKGQDYYLQLNSNLDLIGNSLIFIYPKTGKLVSIPSDIVKEVKINTGGKEMVFRTTGGKKYLKEFKDHKFFQVLKEEPFLFIKLPLKKLIAADYKDVYSADRRYDEYTTYYKYYIMRSDSIFNQIQLSVKSLIKMFPEKKDIINKTIESKTYENDEEMVIAILEKFK